MALKHEADALVAESRQSPVGQSRDVRAVVDDAAAVGLLQRAEHLQQRGLAGAAGAHDARDAPRLHAQAHAAQNLKAAETLAYVL